MGEKRAYLVVSSFDNRACCQCGYRGRRRWYLGAAVVDVINHCQEFGHMPVGIPPVRQEIRSF
jgi:hypothetical protein